jgi:hypothetical protein
LSALWPSPPLFGLTAEEEAARIAEAAQLPASRRLYCAAKIDERHKPATNLTKTEQERSQRCSLQRFAV